MYKEISSQCRQAVQELCERGGLTKGDGIIVGCSTSEVIGRPIGSAGNMETARAILEGLLEGLEPCGGILMVQCCEHLNRAVVLPGEAQRQWRCDEVWVMPQPQAGGALAAAYYGWLEQPCVVSAAWAKAGLDIGDTFIGMHLKPVAVPLRLALNAIGSAHLTAAYTRPPLIGGRRAVYPDRKTR